MHALVRDAYDRGLISWDRRCEMIDMMSERDGGGLYETRDYEKAHPDPEVMCLGVFMEPSANYPRRDRRADVARIGSIV